MVGDQVMEVDSSPSLQRMAPPLVRRSPRLAARHVTNSPFVQLRTPRAGAARKSGRPKHMIWNYFNKSHGWVIESARKMHILPRDYSERSAGTNMQRHIKICVNAPATVKQQVHDHFPDVERRVTSSARGTTATTAAASYASEAAPTDVVTAHEPPELTPIQKQQKFEMKLATMFYLCALPFSLVESMTFRAPFLLVAPWVRFPSRRRRSGVVRAIKFVRELFD
ncbi:hypothetical protein L917_03492 [Phytophthora nicotianae]|uniref:BED-type domain-containing protein n=1 Tax=Phytophthora nicotianae TaxID=4792 RepID=W2LQI9_PHYNI|nr:hypothetical protein L917_03492 [Phytophthora nicotianae]